jgi:hypothetical protein
MNEMTNLERDVLDMLLAGDDRTLQALRKQLPSCAVQKRENTGVGFFTYFDTGDSDPVDSINLRFGDVIGDIEGLQEGAGFVLYVEKGRLTMLEGYSYGEQWPESIVKYKLIYHTSNGARDWLKLRAVLQNC